MEGRRGYILPASMAAANYSNYVMYYGYLHYMLEALMSVRKERMTKERIRGGSFMKICGGYPCQSFSNLKKTRGVKDSEEKQSDVT